VIPFPKLHIAESVLNRIQNTLEERGPLGMSNKQPAPPEIIDPPMIPNAEPVGSAINHQLGTAVAPVAVPPGQEEIANDSMVESVAMGGTAFDGALLGSGTGF
jgi:hypothetical protein